MATKKGTAHMRPVDALNLAAPHTWPASLMPVLLALALAVAVQGRISASLALVLLLIAVLMQSAVNALNDFIDFKKGADTANDQVESSDAVLVYQDFDPREALVLAIVFLVAAFLLGIYCIVCAGWVPLVIALIGAVAIVAYSCGATPISYLPIGEAVSGIVMGGLLTLACFLVLTRQLQWLVLVWSVPLIIGIGLIMMTNNGSDIEKDIVAGRWTLPVVLGRAHTVGLYRILSVAWVAAIAAIVGIWFTPGLIVVPFMVFGAYPLLKKLLSCPLDAEHRIASMGAICNANIVLGAFYAAAVFASTALVVL